MKTLYTKKAEIAHTFNIFFTNIGPNLAANKINSNTDMSHPFYMNSKILINFEFTDVDENTMIDILRQLPLKSSFGFDGISSNLLYNIEVYLVKPLILLAKQTLNSGICPDKLQIAKVIPIFKKGDSTQFTNYIPISLLPVISKVGILEKIIYNNCIVFLKNIICFMKVSTVFALNTQLNWQQCN